MLKGVNTVKWVNCAFCICLWGLAASGTPSGLADELNPDLLPPDVHSVMHIDVARAKFYGGIKSSSSASLPFINVLKYRSESETEDRYSVYLTSLARVDEILVTQPCVQAWKERELVEDLQVIFITSVGCR